MIRISKKTLQSPFLFIFNLLSLVSFIQITECVRWGNSEKSLFDDEYFKLFDYEDYCFKNHISTLTLTLVRKLTLTLPYPSVILSVILPVRLPLTLLTSIACHKEMHSWLKWLVLFLVLTLPILHYPCHQTYPNITPPILYHLTQTLPYPFYTTWVVLMLCLFGLSSKRKVSKFSKQSELCFFQ